LGSAFFVTQRNVIECLVTLRMKAYTYVASTQPCILRESDRTVSDWRCVTLR